VLTPLVKGMLGFYPSAHTKAIRLAPHLPARWSRVLVRNLKVGNGSLNLTMSRGAEEAALAVQSSGLLGFKLELSPGFEPGAAVRRILVNGKPVPWSAAPGDDLHAAIEFPLSGNDQVRYELTPGLRVVEPADAPLPGGSSGQLKILRLDWDRAADVYTLVLEGRAGRSYALEVLAPGKPVRVEGATWEGEAASGRLRIEFPASPAPWSSRTIRIPMRQGSRGRSRQP
jgi:hypothetical protein